MTFPTHTAEVPWSSENTQARMVKWQTVINWYGPQCVCSRMCMCVKVTTCSFNWVLVFLSWCIMEGAAEQRETLLPLCLKVFRSAHVWQPPLSIPTSRLKQHHTLKIFKQGHVCKHYQGITIDFAYYVCIGLVCFQMGSWFQIFHHSFLQLYGWSGTLQNNRGAWARFWASEGMWQSRRAIIFPTANEQSATPRDHPNLF